MASWPSVDVFLRSKESPSVFFDAIGESVDAWLHEGAVLESFVKTFGVSVDTHGCPR